jgi:hypothetical protein
VNTGLAAASRRCTAGSRKVSPATLAARARNLAELLVGALNQPVFVTANGERRRITKREAVIAQLVDKSAGADLCATKMLIDMLQDIEKRAGMASPPETTPFTPADEEVVENLLARLRCIELAKIRGGDTEA